MDMELIRERRIAEMLTYWHGLEEFCPCCEEVMTQSKPVLGVVHAFCKRCAYTCQQWVH